MIYENSAQTEAGRLRAHAARMIVPPVSAFAQTEVAIFAIVKQKPGTLNTRLFQSEQNNEYFLHHRRSGRGHRGRRLSWSASLKDFSPEACVYTRPAWSNHVHLCSRVWRWRFRQAKVAVVTFALLAGCMAAHAEVPASTATICVVISPRAVSASTVQQLRRRTVRFLLGRLPCF
jgi:hypothetical protein